MAWPLVVEVLNHAPRALSAGERLVLVAIAEEVHMERLTSRMCTCSTATLQRLTGMHQRSITNALRRLDEVHHLRVRVPIHLDPSGRPVYAFSGRSARYRVPEFPPPADCGCPVCEQRREATADAHPSGPEMHEHPTSLPQEKGEHPMQKGGASDSSKVERNTHPYREPGTTGDARAPAGSRCGRHDDDPERHCRDCGRLRRAADVAGVRTDPTPVPPPFRRGPATPASASTRRAAINGLSRRLDQNRHARREAVPDAS